MSESAQQLIASALQLSPQERAVVARCLRARNDRRYVATVHGVSGGDGLAGPAQKRGEKILADDLRGR